MYSAYKCVLLPVSHVLDSLAEVLECPKISVLFFFLSCLVFKRYLIHILKP